MYYSINRFIGDGTTTQWEFNFAGGYIDQAHVKVLVTDTLGNETVPAYSWVGPNTISIVPAVAAGYVLEVYRDTPKNLPLVDYTDGAIVSEKNLDTTAEQAVFVAAEVQDRYRDTEAIVVTAATAAVTSAEAAAAATSSAQVAASNAEAAATSAAASASNANDALTSIEADLDALVDGDFSNLLRAEENLADLLDAAVARANLGLGNVDNTGDADKPISTATQVALDGKVGAALLAAPTGAGLVGFKQAGAGAVERTLADKGGECVSVKDFGAVGDGVADDTVAIQAAIDYVIANDKHLLIPAGTYSYSGLNNIKAPGFCLVGEGSGVVTLQYTGTGNALSFDAFTDGRPSDPFVNGLLVGGFSVVGATMTKGVYTQGIARSELFDIKVNGSNGVNGTVGFHFAGTHLSKMTRLRSSYIDGAVPYRGMWFTAGTRAGVNIGACSNNVIESAYPEGNSIGIQIAADGGDQNVFIGGAPEACSVYGMVVGTNCRYNTFIGLGFENLNVTNQDVNDAGIHSRYINCYSSEHFLISGASRGIHVSGGYFERLEIATAAKGATIEDVAVNNWATGSGGFFNSGTGTRWANVYDVGAAAYVFKTKARVSIPVGASPFAYTNNEGIPMKVRVIGGTVSQVLLTRQSDSWVEGNPTASGGGTGTVGTYLLMPGDQITVSYSAAPSMNSIPLSGF